MVWGELLTGSGEGWSGCTSQINKGWAQEGEGPAPTQEGEGPAPTSLEPLCLCALLLAGAQPAGTRSHVQLQLIPKWLRIWVLRGVMDQIDWWSCCGEKTNGHKTCIGQRAQWCWLPPLACCAGAPNHIC